MTQKTRNIIRLATSLASLSFLIASLFEKDCSKKVNKLWWSIGLSCLANSSIKIGKNDE